MNKNFKNFILKLCSFSLISVIAIGCATDIDYKIPAHRFMDPETRGTSILDGEASWFVQTSYQSDHKLTMTEVYDFGVFGSSVNDDQALERTTNFGVQAGLGIVPMFDVLVRDNGDSPAMLVGKVQVLGSSLKERQDGFKLALWGGVGSMDEDEGTMTISSGGSSRTYSGKIEVTPWELGTSVGYRFAPSAIVYLNGVYGNYASKSTLTSTTNPTVVVKGDAILEAVALGLKLGDKGVACHLEVGASRVSWEDDIKIEQEIGTAAIALSLEI